MSLTPEIKEKIKNSLNNSKYKSLIDIDIDVEEINVTHSNIKKEQIDPKRYKAKIKHCKPR